MLDQQLRCLRESLHVSGVLGLLLESLLSRLDDLDRDGKVLWMWIQLLEVSAAHKQSESLLDLQ